MNSKKKKLIKLEKESKNRRNELKKELKKNKEEE